MRLALFTYFWTAVLYAGATNANASREAILVVAPPNLTAEERSAYSVTLAEQYSMQSSPSSFLGGRTYVVSIPSGQFLKVTALMEVRGEATPLTSASDEFYGIKPVPVAFKVRPITGSREFSKFDTGKRYEDVLNFLFQGSQQKKVQARIQTAVGLTDSEVGRLLSGYDLTGNPMEDPLQDWVLSLSRAEFEKLVVEPWITQVTLPPGFPFLSN